MMELNRKKLEKKYPRVVVNLIMNSLAFLFILASPIIVIVRLIQKGRVQIR